MYNKRMTQNITIDPTIYDLIMNDLKEKEDNPGSPKRSISYMFNMFAAIYYGHPVERLQFRNRKKTATVSLPVVTDRERNAYEWLHSGTVELLVKQVNSTMLEWMDIGVTKLGTEEDRKKLNLILEEREKLGYTNSNKGE